MKYEYKEGKEARGNFEDAVKSIFKAPKKQFLRVQTAGLELDARNDSMFVPNPRRAA
jgi:hypothetical protein